MLSSGHLISIPGYNPEAPALSAPSIAAVTPAVQAPDFSVPPPPIPALLSNPPWHPTTYTVPSASASVLVHPPSAPYEPSQPPATVPSVPVVQVSVFTLFFPAFQKEQDGCIDSVIVASVSWTDYMG